LEDSPYYLFSKPSVEDALGVATKPFDRDSGCILCTMGAGDESEAEPSFTPLMKSIEAPDS